MVDQLDLARLTPEDFEALCQDLFSQVLEIDLDLVAPSYDGGVDLRGFASDGAVVVVQCKHWWRTDSRKLVSHMTTSELPKIQALRPSRYVLATSADLTRRTKDRLLEVLKPFGTAPPEVYGIRELVGLLRHHDEVVQRHPRLWFHSADALAAIVYKGLFERSRDLATDMKRSLEVFVPGRSFGEALRILKRHHVLLVSGLPGMGKTALAHAVAGVYAARDYDVVAVSGSTDDIDRAWADDRPQLFLWDDFLGEPSATRAPVPPTGPLLRVIAKVADAADKRLVLTTREYALATAQRDEERLHRAHLNALKCSIGFGEYDRAGREQIVRNHVEASSLPAHVKESIATGPVPAVVARLPHFAPETVASTVRAAAKGLIPAEDLAADLPAYVGDPDRLWRHIVTNQLDDAAADLLAVVFAWGTAVPVPAARAAWVALRRHVARPADPRLFDRALQALVGTLVDELPAGSWRDAALTLHSPSVAEFTAGYLGTRPEVVEPLFASAVHFEQVEGLWDATSGHGVVPGVLSGLRDTVADAVVRTVDAATPGGPGAALHRTAAVADIAAGLGHPLLLDLLADRLDAMTVVFDPYCDEEDDSEVYLVVDSLLRASGEFDDALRALLLPAVREVRDDDVESIYCLTRFVVDFPDLPEPIRTEAGRKADGAVHAALARWDDESALDDERRSFVERIASLRGIALPVDAR